METQNIALSSLELCENNVRKSSDPKLMNELKSSIAAHGLLQNLVVVKHGTKYQVVAGSRRFLCLQQLAKDSASKNLSVPCVIIDVANDREVSLAENIVRENMNPADEYEAFAALLSDKKNTLESVANRFGVDKKHVEQRMQLGRVAPEIIKAFRKNDLDIKGLMAFTITDDHKKQISAFKSLKSYEKSSWHIKSLLTKSMPDKDDLVVKFVTLAAYKESGGRVRSDLFSEEKFLEDGDLVTKLASEKLNIVAEKLKKEGFSFVEIAKEFTDYGYDFRSKFERAEKKPKIDLKNYGAYLVIENNGALNTIFLKKKGKASADALKKTEAVQKKKASGGLSEALRGDLAAYRMEAIQAEVAMNSNLAFDMLVFQQISRALDTGYHSSDIFGTISFTKQNSTAFVREDKTKAKEKMNEIKSKLNLSWRKGTESDRFFELRKLSVQDKGALLAYAMAFTIKPQLVDGKNGSGAYEHALKSLSGDMHSYWRPTKDNYLSRITTESLDKIGKEIFKAAWKPKAMNKSYLVTLLHDAFKDPKKAANGSMETQGALETWLPSGMAFKSLQSEKKSKAA